MKQKLKCMSYIATKNWIWILYYYYYLALGFTETPLNPRWTPLYVSIHALSTLAVVESQAALNQN